MFKEEMKMKLVKRIEKNELLASDWGIYELNEEERKAFGNNYALSQGIFQRVGSRKNGFK